MCAAMEGSPKATIRKDRQVRVVLVTGSSGFLGQHVVKLLQENHPTVAEIRLFDVTPYENKLAHRTDKRMVETVGSVCEAPVLLKAFAGVDCVIHCASLVDVDIHPNTQALEDVNVAGTRNVIEACLQQSVPYLVYTSSVGILPMAGSPMSVGNKNHCFDAPYAESKQKAEDLLISASGRLLGDGSAELRVVLLRLTPLYGEGDQNYMAPLILSAHYTGNTVFKMEGPRFQVTYVGNAAAAHLQAMDVICRSDALSGRAFTITDDTPQKTFEFLRPFLESRGCRLASFSIPYPLVLMLAILLTLVLSVIKSVYRPKLTTFTVPNVRYFCRAPFFDGSDARVRLGYRPPYTYAESVARSLPHYRGL